MHAGPVFEASRATVQGVGDFGAAKRRGCPPNGTPRKALSFVRLEGTVVVMPTTTPESVFAVGRPPQNSTLERTAKGKTKIDRRTATRGWSRAISSVVLLTTDSWGMSKVQVSKRLPRSPMLGCGIYTTSCSGRSSSSVPPSLSDVE